MYASGMRFREIERLTGVNHNTIIYWAKQAEDISSQKLKQQDSESSPEVNEAEGE
jgi:transposase